MKIHRLSFALGLLMGGMSVASATNIGFGQIGGSNAGIAAGFASNATVDANGYVISLGGATPDIGLTWDSRWQVHHSGFFSGLENTFVGGGAWDNDGGQSIGQLDYGNNTTITFTATTGYALLLNSFDFGLTGETLGTATWELSLTAVSTSVVVWNQTVDFNVTTSAGESFVISPNFIGEDGESYVLNFNRTAESYNSNGRAGIDNLEFGQTAVPEPGTVALLGVAGFGLILLSRRRK